MLAKTTTGILVRTDSTRTFRHVFVEPKDFVTFFIVVIIMIFNKIRDHGDANDHSIVHMLLREYKKKKRNVDTDRT